MNAKHRVNDLLYNPRLSVAGVPEIIARWKRDSELARASLAGYLDVPYGSGDAEKLDVFRANPDAGPCRGMVMFIHPKNGSYPIPFA